MGGEKAQLCASFISWNDFGFLVRSWCVVWGVFASRVLRIWAMHDGSWKCKSATIICWKPLMVKMHFFLAKRNGEDLTISWSFVLLQAVVTRARYMINPDAVYRIAMRKLNTSAAVLEVMGAPLTGTDVRAYVMSGGGLRFKNFRPRLSGKRCFLIFPITGGERRGLVSIEVKKKKGQVVPLDNNILYWFLLCELWITSLMVFLNFFLLDLFPVWKDFLLM